MSTRCQLQIVEKRSGDQEKITLYYHSDGYPDNMISLIYRAWIMANDAYFPHPVGRAMVAAEMLYLTDREGFKWENGYRLHDDIEYYYRIHCWYSKQEDRPIWEIDVYERNCSFFAYDLTLADFKLIESRQNIEDLVKKYNRAKQIIFRQ